MVWVAALPMGSHAAPLPGIAPPSGISLGWQDCRTGSGTGSVNQNFGCGIAVNDLPMFPGLRLAAPVDSVIGMELVIDVDVATDQLPTWWHMEPGGCHSSPSGWNVTIALTSNCADPWAGVGTASIQGWIAGTPGNSTRHGRLLLALAAVPGTLVSLDADVSYSLARLALRSDNTLTCQGCSIPACLVFNSVLVRRLPGSSPETLIFSTAEISGGNQIVWQGGSGADCASVPVRRSTWGALKALYR